MNLDDFIVPTSIASPAGVTTSLATMFDGGVSPASSRATAIPIKHQQQRFQPDGLDIARASAPTVAPVASGRGNNEFGYVQRHVRKTSIDERRVRTVCP